MGDIADDMFREIEFEKMNSIGECKIHETPIHVDDGCRQCEYDYENKMNKYNKMKPNEIAEKIRNYLEKFEADPIENKTFEHGTMKTKKYYGSQCVYFGRRFHITYVSYQGSEGFVREKAIKYLMWLDEGNKGKHYEMDR